MVKNMNTPLVTYRITPKGTVHVIRTSDKKEKEDETEKKNIRRNNGQNASNLVKDKFRVKRLSKPQEV